jgi:hypothetical protein
VSFGFPGEKERSKALRAQNQSALIQFLSTDIDIAFTFLATARVATGPGHATRLVEKARRVLRSARHFCESIKDQANGRKFTTAAMILPLFIYPTGLFISDVLPQNGSVPLNSSSPAPPSRGIYETRRCARRDEVPRQYPWWYVPPHKGALPASGGP